MLPGYVWNYSFLALLHPFFVNLFHVSDKEGIAVTSLIPQRDAAQHASPEAERYRNPRSSVLKRFHLLEG
jgi:hypothetical protein